MAANELNLRLGIEQAICRRLVNELVQRGYHLIWDAGEDELVDMASSRAMPTLCDGHDGMFNYDDGHLLVYKKQKVAGSERKADYFVRLVFGNDGWDVISDYTSSLEKHMENTLRLARACEEIPVAAFAKAVTDYDMGGK